MSNGEIIGRLDDPSGQTLREYIWLGDIPLAVVDKVATGSPVIYYVHSDHLGRPARMTAQNQAWVWDVIYSPFGETSYIMDQSGNARHPLPRPMVPAGERAPLQLASPL